MARYTGPKVRISRAFGAPILGNPKDLAKSNPPGQHGKMARRRQQSEYAIQLKEKQKAKYLYGLLERQFRNTFQEAARRKGSTGENLIRLLESRLDNVVYRLGLAHSRPQARQLVAHKHVTVNGKVVNIPSFRLAPGDVVALKLKSAHNGAITDAFRPKDKKVTWLDWDQVERKGSFLHHPEAEQFSGLGDLIGLKVQLIVELYSR